MEKPEVSAKEHRLCKRISLIGLVGFILFIVSMCFLSEPKTTVKDSITPGQTGRIKENRGKRQPVSAIYTLSDSGQVETARVYEDNRQFGQIPRYLELAKAEFELCDQKANSGILRLEIPNRAYDGHKDIINHLCNEWEVVPCKEKETAYYGLSRAEIFQTYFVQTPNWRNIAVFEIPIPCYADKFVGIKIRHLNGAVQNFRLVGKQLVWLAK